MPAPQRSNRPYRIVARLVRPLLLTVTRPDWRGTEHLPRDRGFIAAANHMTNIDPVTFAHFLYDNGLAPRILAKSSLFAVPGVGRVLRATGQIPVFRNSVQAGESLSAAVAAVEMGECVAVFPEGTLTRDPGLWPMAGKTGIARLALTTRAPVVPIAQWGAQDLLGRYEKLPKPFPPKKVTVVAGPPVDLSDLYDRPQDGAVLREATERVMAAITALLEEVRGETAPAQRYDMRRAAGADAGTALLPDAEVLPEAEQPGGTGQWEAGHPPDTTEQPGGTGQREAGHPPDTTEQPGATDQRDAGHPSDTPDRPGHQPRDGQRPGAGESA